MRDDLNLLIQKLDSVVASCVGVVNPDILEPIARGRNVIRDRMAFPDDVLVAAFAGGTGSGKSSLFNAVANEDLRQTSGLRPTSLVPAALCHPSDAEALAGLFSRIGIEEVYRSSPLDGICLVDLPDIDGRQSGHRHHVARLLPVVDLVVWVTDPEKYVDASLHREYLMPLSEYQNQFIFVLNQIDRLRPEEAEAVVADFESVLAEDGITTPVIIKTSAVDTAGATSGIEELTTTLKSLGLRQPLYEKALIDIASASKALKNELGGGASLDFEERWKSTSSEIADAASRGQRAEAQRFLTAFLERLSKQLGSALGRRVHETFAEVRPEVGMLLKEHPPLVTERRQKWWDGLGRSMRNDVKSPAPESTDLAVELDRILGVRLREIVGQRARAAAEVVDLDLRLSVGSS